MKKQNNNAVEVTLEDYIDNIAHIDYHNTTGPFVGSPLYYNSDTGSLHYQSDRFHKVQLTSTVEFCLNNLGYLIRDDVCYVAVPKDDYYLLTPIDENVYMKARMKHLMK